MKKKGVRRGNPISSPSHKRLHREATKSVIVIGVSLIILLILLLLAVFVYQKQAVVGQAFGDANTCITPPGGMVAWWTGDNTLDSKSGEGAQRLTTQGGNLPVLYDPNGKAGAAFKLWGDNYFLLNNGASLISSDQFSIEMWVKLEPQDNFNSRYGLISTWADVANNEKGWFIEAGKYPQDGSMGREGRILFKSTNDVRTNWQLDNNFYGISPNTWTHYVLTYDGTEFRLYLGGVFKGTQSRAGVQLASSTNPLYLGYSKGSGSDVEHYLKGAMDEVTIYNRALSADEISQLYNNGKCKAVQQVQEICNDGADNDNDQIVDCMDNNCYLDLTCKGNSCGLDEDGVDRVVTWSYRLPDEAGLQGANQLVRNGCYNRNQCVADGGAVDPNFWGERDQGVYSPGGVWGDSVLCFTDQNWYKCNENIPEDQLRKGNYICFNNQETNKWEWTLLCLPETKYQFRNQNHEICSGLAWKQCEDGQVNIADTNVKFTCAEDGTITKKERNCYNEEDDDRDETADQQDADCLGDQTIFLNENEWYETIIRAGENPVTVITPDER